MVISDSLMLGLINKFTATIFSEGKGPNLQNTVDKDEYREKSRSGQTFWNKLQAVTNVIPEIEGMLEESNRLRRELEEIKCIL
jgi:hypothetical protein